MHALNAPGGKKKANLPRQKHIPNTRLRKVKHRSRPRPLDDLQVERVEHRADELALRARHERPEQVSALHYVEPLGSRPDAIGVQPVLEQRLECRTLLVAFVVGYEADEAAFGDLG